SCPRPLKIFSLEVADQQAVFAQEERVVVPSRLAEGIQHLRPDLSVSPLVFIESFGLYLQHKADSFHIYLNAETPQEGRHQRESRVPWFLRSGPRAATQLRSHNPGAGWGVWSEFAVRKSQPACCAILQCFRTPKSRSCIFRETGSPGRAGTLS